VGTFSKNCDSHPETICRLDEVKRRAIVDVLDLERLLAIIERVHKRLGERSQRSEAAA
jgi:hypothetical protein